MNIAVPEAVEYLCKTEKLSIEACPYMICIELLKMAHVRSTRRAGSAYSGAHVAG